MKLSTKNLTIPTKEIAIEGFKDTITIYPISGFGLLKLKTLSLKMSKNLDDVLAQEECVRFALKWGCKCDEEDINYLILNLLVACFLLTKQIILYSGEYNLKKINTSSIAKKKSEK